MSAVMNQSAAIEAIAAPKPSSEQKRAARFAKRKLINRIVLALALAAMSFGLFWLAWILWETLRLGLSGISLAVFTEMTPPPNDAGGLANALYGYFVLPESLPPRLEVRFRLCQRFWCSLPVRSWAISLGTGLADWLALGFLTGLNPGFLTRRTSPKPKISLTSTVF